MICLDTNYLILGLSRETPEAAKLVAWIQSGELLITPVIAWYEFLCGPVTPIQITTMRAFLHEIVLFDEAHAAEAARLFNAVNRNRRLRVDAMIAGTATLLNAKLATNNQPDFAPFVAHGLALV